MVEDRNLISHADVRKALSDDKDYLQLKKVIKSGFPKSRKVLKDTLRQYWKVCNKLPSRCTHPDID